MMNKAQQVTISYRVPYADTDQMRVVYYANYLAYFERARNELMRACGLTYREFEAMGFALPVSEAVLHYHHPATYDDLLSITAWVEQLKGVRMVIRCEVRREDQLLVDGHTVHACVDIQRLRPVRLPAEVLARLSGVTGESEQ